MLYTIVRVLYTIVSCVFGCLIVVLLSVHARRAVHWWHSKRAIPPKNVRVICADGSTVPIDLYFACRRRGVDQWVATSTIPFRPSDRVCIGVLPARCEVTLLYTAKFYPPVVEGN